MSQINKRILIMSVFAPSELNWHWYFLQKKFIKKNTAIPYDFKIITNGIGTEIFDQNTVVQINDSNIGHPAGIVQILEYMRRNQASYNGFLILDSDAFPVRSGWHEILTSQMTRFNKSISAPIRYENLDTFPHPCVVYMTKEGLNNNKISFDYEVVKNLLGESIDEVGGAMVNVIDDVLPLLRTNRVNLHPLAAGIYHHLFYHHAAGSRGFDFRVIKAYKFCEHWIDNDAHNDLGEYLLNSLVQDPENFIDKLMYGY